MASFTERSPNEKETLIFDSPDKAREFTEAAQEKISKEKRNGMRRDREIVAEAVANEFAQSGHAVHSLKKPWQHTPEEHVEVEDLTDLAFSKDLTTALRKAKVSRHYPRNLDLFHDVLTGELYEALREHKLHKQPLIGWTILTLSVVIIFFIIFLLVLLTL